MSTRLAVLSGLLAMFAGNATADDVLTYHNSPDRHGVYRIPGLTFAAATAVHPDTAFKASIPGHVYAQPLFWHPAGAQALVIVASESNVVSALDSRTGATVWQTKLGVPVPLNEVPCGNIDPDGVTGTPVIDPSTKTLFLDALVKTPSGARHRVYALSPGSGSVLSGWPIDVQGELSRRGATFDSRVQGERGALLHSGNSVFVAYGGKFGDCGNYRGTVIEIHPSTPGIAAVWQTRARGGGIWAQGGLAGDGDSVFATTGNTFDARDWGDGEGIIRLKSGLARPSSGSDYFTPSNWKELDNEDSDLGGTEALPFDAGSAKSVISFGKDGNAYLVGRDSLGGMGGALAIVKESGDAIITAPAILQTQSGAMVAITNRGGKCGATNITMLRVNSGKQISNLWCASFRGRGAPILSTSDGASNAIVWVAGAEGDNLLHGFNAATGQVVFAGAGTHMEGLHHFQTLIAAEDRLYVAADDRVYAFTWEK